MSLMSPALAGGFFTTSTTWEALKNTYNSIIKKQSTKKYDLKMGWGPSVLAALSQTRWKFLKAAELRMASTNPQKWHRTRKARILCIPKESSVMTGSRGAMVGRLCRFSRKMLKLEIVLRLECIEALSPTADLRECSLLRDASILGWEEIKERAKWSSFKLHVLFYEEDNKDLRLFMCSLQQDVY